MSFPDHTKIKSFTITIQPRYSETDQGGVIHHSVYPVYFEMGRTELLRANGLAYKDLETAGVFFVIAELRIKYRRPAFYDEKLNLETTITNVTASKVEHSYKLTRPDTGELLSEAESVLACVDAQGKIRRMPEFMYPAEA
jgi:acyl-CoA thioester hydrolase